MRIVFPDMHQRLPKSFAMAVQNMGGIILLPDLSFADKISYGTKWTEEAIAHNPYMSDCDNIKAIGFEEFNDNPPDVLIVSCYEVEKDIIPLWQGVKDKGTKLLHYQGNKGMPYNLEFVSNIITTDATALNVCNQANKHCLQYFPWVDYGLFSSSEYSDSNIIQSYIHNYSQYFPEAYALSESIKQDNPEFIFEYQTTAEYLDVPRLMRESVLTLHVKPSEGYGFSIIESMATGRPVVLYRPYVEGCTYKTWAIEGATCIYFDSLEELKAKLKRYMDNTDNRHLFQEVCATTIRSIIDNDIQSANLSSFLSGL